MASWFLFDVQLFFQTFLYFCGAATGFVIAIPVGITTAKFDGHCLLYSSLTWSGHTFVPDLKPAATCNFIMYLAIFACIVYGLAMTGYYAYALCQKDPNTGSGMWAMPFVLSNALVTFLVFVSSCVLSVGFNQFCTDVRKGRNTDGCVDGERFKWGNEKYDGSSYYGFLKTAEITSWISSFIWLCQTSLCILRVVRNRRLRSKGMLTTLVTEDME